MPRLRAATVVLVWLLSAAVMAAPQGGTITAGSATIIHPSSTSTVINQATGQAIINWNSFSIGANESVTFAQPSALAVALNRVTGVDPSVILGSLTANGRIFLLNPNGVLFGAGSRVDTGAIVVSTLGMSDQDFLKGSYTLTAAPGAPGAYVVNQGQIHGGSVVLVAPLVSNEGTIVANLGHVALAAGDKVQLNVDGHGLIDVVLPLQKPACGEVIVSQDAYSGVLRALYGNPVLTADGNVALVNANGTLVNSGSITAAGGAVTLTAAKALTMSGAIDVSGANGGCVTLRSAGAVDFDGSIAARGITGNGGTVEISGTRGRIDGQVDTSAPHGKAGTLLIDPVNICIVGGCGNAVCNQVLCNGHGTVGTCCPPAQLTLGANTISALSKNNDVILGASNRITVQDLAANGGTLTLQGHGLALIACRCLTFANVNDTISATGTGGVTLLAGCRIKVGNVSTQGGRIIVNTCGTIQTGNLTACGGHIDVLAPGCINVGAARRGGEVTILSLNGGNVTVGSVTAGTDHVLVCLQNVCIPDLSLFVATTQGGSVTVGQATSGGSAAILAQQGSVCVGSARTGPQGALLICSQGSNIKVGQAASGNGTMVVRSGTKASLLVETCVGSVTVGQASALGCSARIDIASGKGDVTVGQASACGVVCVFTLGGNVTVGDATASGRIGLVNVGNRGGNLTLCQARVGPCGTIAATDVAGGCTFVRCAHADCGRSQIIASAAGNLTIGTISATGPGSVILLIGGSQGSGSILPVTPGGAQVASGGSILLNATGTVGGVNQPIAIRQSSGKLFVSAAGQTADLSINLTGTLTGFTTCGHGIVFNPCTIGNITANLESQLKAAPGVFGQTQFAVVPPGFILFDNLVVNPPSFLSESQFLSDTPGYFTQLLLLANTNKLVGPHLIELIDDKQALPQP